MRKRLTDIVVDTLCVFLRIFVATLIPYLPIDVRWKNEHRVRMIISVLTGEEFISTRDIPWLVNPITKRRLEIDCYNEKLGLAMEYNGIQHYKNTKIFNQDLEYRVYLDRLKEKLCYENGATLIIIPYTIDTKSLCSYILSKLELIEELQTTKCR